MKWLKIIGGVVGAVVLIGIIALTLLVIFVNPNRFKPVITDQVKKYTGRTMVIDGDLSWTIYPSLGVKVGHLELDNPDGFKEKIFAEVDGATVSVQIIPLFSSRIKSDGIILHGLKLNLIKTVDGKTNWEDLQGKSAATTTPQTTDSTDSSTAKKMSIGLVVSAIDISDATVNWDNQQAKQNLEIKNFELHAKDINLTKSFPFNSSFEFAGKNPDVTGKLTLTSSISLSVDRQRYSFDKMNLNIKVNQAQKKFDIDIKGNMSADLVHDKLQLDNFMAQIANLKLTGKMNVADLLNKPKATGHLQMQPFDVKKWLQATGQDAASVKTFKDLSGDFDFTAGTSLQSVDLKGNLKVDQVQANKVKVSNIVVTTALQNGILNLAPMSANLYNGTMQGQAKINLTTATPQISLNAKLANVQAKPLLADLATAPQKFKLDGVGNVDMQITTSGTSGDEAIKNLNGTVKLAFNNGVIEGIDIGYLLDSARAVARKQATNRTNTDKTEFGTLTATGNIHNGIISNNDLLLDSNSFASKGSGTINLVTQQLTYRLQTSIKSNEPGNNPQNLYGTAIPILISGNMSSPSIQLDTQALMEAVAKQQIEKVKSSVKDKIQEQIKNGKIPGNAGAILNNLLGQ